MRYPDAPGYDDPSNPRPHGSDTHVGPGEYFPGWDPWTDDTSEGSSGGGLNWNWLSKIGNWFKNFGRWGKGGESAGGGGSAGGGSSFGQQNWWDYIPQGGGGEQGGQDSAALTAAEQAAAEEAKRRKEMEQLRAEIEKKRSQEDILRVLSASAASQRGAQVEKPLSARMAEEVYKQRAARQKGKKRRTYTPLPEPRETWEG